MKPLASVMMVILCSIVIREFADAAWSKLANSGRLIPTVEVNRSQKSDRLPIAQREHSMDRAQLMRLPLEAAPFSSNKSGCPSPIDVQGRCFASIPTNILTLGNPPVG
jgi:hypothetical protein